MHFKKIIALVLILVVQQFGYCCAADVDMVKSYYLLKYEYEAFLNPLTNAGATEKELLGFFEDIEEGLNRVENLTRENFEVNLKDVLLTVATYRDNRALSATIFAVYQNEIDEYSETGVIPERMRGMYDALVKIIFGDGYVDKSSLAILYEQKLLVYKGGMSSYTEESVRQFKAALDNALAVLKNSNATAEEVTASTQSINNAYASLALRPAPVNPGGGNSGGGNSGGGNTPSVLPTTPQTPENEQLFSDVSEKNWFYTSVSYLAEKNILNGYEDGSFRPDALISREEAAKILCVALGLENSGTDISYNDIPENAWYKDYVYCITANNVMQGMDNGRFGVGLTLTRQDLAVIAHRLVNNGLINNEYNEVSDNIPFEDIAEAAEYARESINEIKKFGIINGVGNNKFAPKDGVTRAQVAQIVYNLIK